MIGLFSYVSILMLGCVRPSSTVSPTVRLPPTGISDSDTTPSSAAESKEELSLDKILSAHDDTACRELPYRTKEPWVELNVIVEEVLQPPWAGMRAATCMIESYPEASKDLFLGWMMDENKKGLAYLLAANIDRFPVEAALALVQAALDGPHAQGCKTRFMNSEQSAVRDALP